MKKILSMILTVALAISVLSTAAFASENSNKNSMEGQIKKSVGVGKDGVDKSSTSSLDIDKVTKVGGTSDYLTVSKPTNGQTIYIGDKVKFDFYVYDTWARYYTAPYVGFFKTSTNKLVDTDKWEVAYVNKWTHYVDTYTFKSSKFSTGKYQIMICNWPCYSNGNLLTGVSDWNIPTRNITVNLKKLVAPKNLALTTGKAYVKVRYSAAAGATKYEIYRSTAKSSGYTKIASTTSTSFTDKKAKKGKRYYYKVRTVRTKNGASIRSSFTAPVRSGTVK